MLWYLVVLFLSDVSCSIENLPCIPTAFSSFDNIFCYLSSFRLPLHPPPPSPPPPQQFSEFKK